MAWLTAAKAPCTVLLSRLPRNENDRTTVHVFTCWGLPAASPCLEAGLGWRPPPSRRSGSEAAIVAGVAVVGRPPNGEPALLQVVTMSLEVVVLSESMNGHRRAPPSPPPTED